MIKARQWRQQGAPLRAFFLVIAVWVLGRLLWEGSTPNWAIGARADIVTATIQKKGGPSSGYRTDPSVFQNGEPISVPVNQIANSSLTALTKYHRFEDVPPASVPESRTLSVQQPVTNPFPYANNRIHVDPDMPVSVKLAQQSSTPSDYGNVSKAIPPNIHRQKNWSGYFWVFARQNSSGLRPNSTVALPQSGGAQYGGSQVGAILALKVAGTEKKGLSFFSRLSSPLDAQGEEELAIGSYVKPFEDFPVSVYAEQRFGRSGDIDRGTAVYVAGGTGPDELLRGISLETYGQAGFVLRKRSTYFFDGSANLKTELFKENRKSLTIGAGIWAGGQDNVSRMDVGPRVNFDLPIADLPTRVSVDWRHRVAGNARPESGLAVSVSTGF